MGDLLVDGTSVQTYAYNVTSRASRWVVPGRRGDNAALPGVHGTLWTPGKPYDENTLVWNMWALGCEPDGSMPSGSRQDRVIQHLDALMRLFSTPHLRTVVQRGTPGGDRQFRGEVTAAIDLSSMAGGTRAEFAVEWTLPDPFWQDVVAQTQTVNPGSGATSKTLHFSAFNGSTAPMTGSVFEVTGPAQSPVLADLATGQWVKLGQSLTAGQVWRVDTASWTSTVAGVNKVGVTTHGGGATFLDVTPQPSGQCMVGFSAAGGVTAATSVKMTGRRKYLLA